MCLFLFSFMLCVISMVLVLCFVLCFSYIAIFVFLLFFVLCVFVWFLFSCVLVWLVLFLCVYEVVACFILLLFAIFYIPLNIPSLNFPSTFILVTIVSDRLFIGGFPQLSLNFHSRNCLGRGFLLMFI